MALNCLLLTSDAMLMGVIRTGFSAMNVDLEMRTDTTSAIEPSTRQHLDGFVIDCDDLPQATDLVSQIRNTRSNKRSVILAVVNGTTSVSMAIEAGANFVLGKPVQDKQLRSFLDIALPTMQREHRRYFRHKVDVPIELLCQGSEAFTGKIINVSESGLALTRFASVEGVVTVRFGLPCVPPKIFQAKAEVVWSDAFAMGLRFLSVDPSCHSLFEAWLDSLEELKQFQESDSPRKDLHGLLDNV